MVKKAILHGVVLLGITQERQASIVGVLPHGLMVEMAARIRISLQEHRPNHPVLQRTLIKQQWIIRPTFVIMEALLIAWSMAAFQDVQQFLKSNEISCEKSSVFKLKVPESS